ncbi:MAG: CHAT domain-containing protein [Myxococcales bacterium]|nr:CHAT domain-containing protein [Myxococcales bacterium]
MKRVVLGLQIILAATLVVLWLRWNPLSPDCQGTQCEDEPNIYSEVKRVPPAVSAEPLPEAPFEVEYGGCEMVMALGEDSVRCIYGPGRDLLVWVGHPRADETWLELDGRRLEPRRYSRPEEHGQGLAVALEDDDARRLTMGIAGEHEWSLTLLAKDRLTTAERTILRKIVEESNAIEQKLSRGQLEVMPGVRSLIAKAQRHGLVSEAVRMALASAYHLTDAGRPDLALELIDDVRPLAERYPWGRAAWSIYRGMALLEQGRLVEAAVAYRTGGRYAVRVDDSQLQIDALSNYAAVLAQLGYFEAAAYWGTVALRQARQHGRAIDLADTLGVVAEANLRLREAGRAHDDPVPLLRERLEMFGADRPFAHVRGNAAFHLSMAELAVLDQRPAVALEHLEAFARLDSRHMNADERAHVLDLRLQVLVTQASSDPHEVRATLAALERASTEAVSKSVRWQTWVRQGEVLEREGDLPGAQRAYERAEQLLDEMIPLALTGISGEIAPVRRRQGTQRLVSVLLAQDRPEEALCVLRQAQSRVGLLARVFRRLDDENRSLLRSRVQRYLQAKRSHEAMVQGANELTTAEREQTRRNAARLQQDLDRSALEILATQAGYYSRPRCEQLSPRRPRELLMGLYAQQQDLLVLVQDDDGTTSRILTNYADLARVDDAEWLGSLLLDPLDDRLERATQVRVLASTEGAAIDVHALPWRGRPLIEQIPVVYGLDLPPQDLRDSESIPAHVLIVADTLAKGTKDEAVEVQRVLDGAGWIVEHRSSVQLSASWLRDELGKVELFHYAGHAYYDTGSGPRRVGSRERADNSDDPILRLWPPYPGGAAAEPSYIPLGNRGRLDVQDILMMEQVPRSVVLMGCATGVHDERMAYGGFSLATAFLGAGAEVVVASTREVDGDEASKVGRGLYERLDARVGEDAGQWFQRAIRWARNHELPRRAVRDYRVFVP